MHATTMPEPSSSETGAIALGAAAISHSPDFSGAATLTGRSRWGVGIFITALLAGLLATAFAQSPHNVLGFHGCRIEPFLPRFGRETETVMRLLRESECSIWLRTGSVSIDDVSVVETPSNGSLRMRGRSGVIYRPAKDFTGTDGFVFAIKGRDGGLAKSALVRVHVRIQ